MHGSPRDWPLSWRMTILMNVSFYNMLGSMNAAAPPPTFGLLMAEFHVSSSRVSNLPTFTLLAQGFSNVLALPMAALVGRRYTILISLVLFLVFSIWGAEAGTFNDLLTSRILGGLSAGLIEALGPGIVFDTFPEHHLASAMVVYICMLAAGSSVGPVFAGLIADRLNSWRWFFRIMSIAIFLTLVASIAMLPETTHEDPYPQMLPPNVSEHEQSEKPFSANVEGQLPTSGGTEGSSSDLSQDSHPPLRQQWISRSFTLRYVEMDWKLAFRNFYRPFQTLLLPQVVVTTLVFGLTIGWTVLVSIILSILYAQPPYLWSSTRLGLLSLGPLIGLLVGLPAGGMAADFLFNRAIRRGDGTPDPRTRLPATLIGALISPAGCVLLGYALRTPEQWAPVVVGWGMLNIGLTCSANVLLTYAVDTAPSRASHIGMIVNVTKNSIAFGVSYASVTWTATMGSVGQFWLMAGILWFAYLLVVPVWIFSDTLGRMTNKVFGREMRT